MRDQNCDYDKRICDTSIL